MALKNNPETNISNHPTLTRQYLDDHWSQKYTTRKLTCPLKRGHFKIISKGKYHYFSRDMLVLGRLMFLVDTFGGPLFWDFNLEHLVPRRGPRCSFHWGNQNMSQHPSNIPGKKMSNLAVNIFLWLHVCSIKWRVAAEFLFVHPPGQKWKNQGPTMNDSCSIMDGKTKITNLKTFETSVHVRKIPRTYSSIQYLL